MVSTETASEELCETPPSQLCRENGDDRCQQCSALCCLCAGFWVKIPSPLTPVLGVASTLRPLWRTNGNPSRASEIDIYINVT